MDQFTAQTVLSYLNIFSLCIQLILLIYIFKNKDHINRGTLSDIHMIDETRERSDAILSKAVKEANSIVANAELRGISLFAKNKLDSNKYGAEYLKQLAEFQTAMQDQLRESLKKTEVSYEQMMQQTNQTIAHHIAQNQLQLEQKATELINGTQHTLNSFISEVQETVKEQVNKELVSTRQYAQEYKQRKIAAIDDNLVELIEKTVALALGKILPMKDHADLVYKALEKAKNEHVFVS